jgi:hypothetical protein
MFVERQVVTITVDASGAGTGFTAAVTGFVRAIRYVPDGSTPYDTNAIVTVTGETTGIAIVTITHIGTTAIDLYPRAALVSVANAAALFAAGGTALVDLIPVAGERIKIGLAQAGNATTGAFYVSIG